MSSTKKLQLIDGTFSVPDGKEVLMNLFAAKLNFHQLKNFSAKERTGKEDPIAKKRIPIIKKEMKKLEKLLVANKKGNKKMIISAEIHITLTKE